MKHLYLILTCFFTITIYANDWTEVTRTCPVCIQQHDFWQYTNNSDEIYRRPSRFQYVFSPFTDSRIFYSCASCSYTTLGWDFQRLTLDKLELVKQVLKDLHFDHKKYQDYTTIPIHIKLNIAEEIYKIWEKDENFWCEFYRSKAYHLEKEAQATKKENNVLLGEKPHLSEPQKKSGKVKILLSSLFYPFLRFVISEQTKDYLEHYQYQYIENTKDYLEQETVNARKKALEIAQEIIEDSESPWPKKEFLYIAGAMEFLLDNKDKAKFYFQEGLKVDYSSRHMTPELAQGYNAYLNELLQEYLEKFD